MGIGLPMTADGCFQKSAEPDFYIEVVVFI
jgi:hypothetical protein